MRSASGGDANRRASRIPSSRPRWSLSVFFVIALVSAALTPGFNAHAADPPPVGKPTPAEREAWSAATTAIRDALVSGRSKPRLERFAADVDVYAKALQWALELDEFPKAEFVKWTATVARIGQERAAAFAQGKTPWLHRPGLATTYGYVSALDGSTQPFAVTLPADFDPEQRRRWPLHVVLHGRDEGLNEVKFLQQFEGKTPKEPLSWIQLDVFGRTNNAYRWAGEADVFEALAAVEARFPIDDRRITLWGFSMGGAGAWHLGLHHPDRWSSVGAGAGFADTVEYLKLKEPLPPIQQKLIRIYDAREVAMNAANVPTIGYGGELDKQLAAAQLMQAQAAAVNTTIKVLIGPKTEHKFHPESWKEFLAFHQTAAAAGKPVIPEPRTLRFTTCTLKYNQCFWASIEEQLVPYEPSVVEGAVSADGDVVVLATKNVGLLQIDRDVAESIRIDESNVMPLRSAAGGLLPGVYYERTADGWLPMDYRQSRDYTAHPERSKRRHLQGPIDDAFTRPFVCVRGTGTPWSPEQHDYAIWSLERFRQEYRKYFRADLPIVDDTKLQDEDFEGKHLILFGDPGSNRVLARVLGKLPLTWTKTELKVGDRTYDPTTHAVPLVYPNPLQPSRYVVLNSGHTFHEAEFKGSNAQLYPRLGDIAVLQFRRQQDNRYAETAVWTDLFTSQWELVP